MSKVPKTMHDESDHSRSNERVNSMDVDRVGDTSNHQPHFMDTTFSVLCEIPGSDNKTFLITLADLQQGRPPSLIKEFIVEKLKMLRGLQSVKDNIFPDDITLYTDAERTQEIASYEMPTGRKFYAILTIQNISSPFTSEMLSNTVSFHNELFKIVNEAVLAAQMPKDPVESQTPSALGETTKHQLEQNGSFCAFLGNEGREPIWNANTQKLASAIKTEDELVKFITPYLNEILSSFGMVFVNSESFPWLSQSLVSLNTKLKPDGFACHPGMYISKVPGVKKKKEQKKDPEDSRHFGIPIPKLYNNIIMFECKLQANNAAFGEVIMYLCHLKTKNRPAILMDATSFWLIYTLGSSVNRVQQVKWTDPGSKEVLEIFIQNHVSLWTKLLIDACSQFKVSVIEGNSFLGMGAYGCVFKVRGEDKKDVALKIVPKEHINVLILEAIATDEVSSTNVTVRVLTPVHLLCEDQGAAFLTSPVGIHISRDSLKIPTIEQLFNTLYILHEKGHVHGDSRLSNVILYEGHILWIDFLHSSLWSQVLWSQVEQDQHCYLFSNDLLLLTRSILGVDHSFQLPIDITDAIQDAVKNVSPNNYNLVSQALAKYMHKNALGSG